MPTAHNVIGSIGESPKDERGNVVRPFANATAVPATVNGKHAPHRHWSNLGRPPHAPEP